VVRPAKRSAELTTINASRYRARASRPSARNKVASQLLIYRAATPPLRGGEFLKHLTRFVQAIHDAQRVADLAERRVGFNTLNQRRH
jgi:hypothetical protein